MKLNWKVPFGSRVQSGQCGGMLPGIAGWRSRNWKPAIEGPRRNRPHQIAKRSNPRQFHFDDGAIEIIGRIFTHDSIAKSKCGARGIVALAEVEK